MKKPKEKLYSYPDACKECTAYMDLESCKKTSCQYHNLWMVKQLLVELEDAKKQIEKLQHEYMPQKKEVKTCKRCKAHLNSTFRETETGCTFCDWVHKKEGI